MYLGIQHLSGSPGACVSAGKVHQISNSLLLDMNADINLIQKAGAYFPASVPKLVFAQVFAL